MTPPLRFASAMLLSLAFMSLSTTAFARDSEPAVAEKLIRTMRLDQFMVQGAAAQFLRKSDAASSAEPTDKQRLDLLRCLERADTSNVVRALASVTARQLSTGEMKEALAFYASSTGKKHVQRELVEARKTYGYELAGASPSISGEESERLERFRKTPTYAKLEEIPLKLREGPRESQKAVYMSGDLVVTTCLRTLGVPRD